MKFYKITNENEQHRNMKYQTGLNTDVVPYEPKGDCRGGGLYFSREDILAFLDYGVWIREVTIPKGDPKPYKNPGKPVKWKAHRIILGKRRRITARLVGELADGGARTNVFNADGLIPLAVAMLDNDRILFDVLIEKTKDLNIRAENTGNTPLHLAITSRRHISYVRKLVEKGVKLNIKNGSEETPLFLACKIQSYETVRYLLKAGADVNMINRFNYDNTCLHLAVEEEDKRLVSLLMKHGANPNPGDIYVAETYGMEEISKLLKRKKG